MNSLAAWSKMEWSSSPMVVTDEMVFGESGGDLPIYDACVERWDGSRPSSLQGFMSL